MPNKRIALRRIKYLTAMTHIMIEDNTPEGKWLLELIRGHKSVTVMDEKKRRGSGKPWQNAMAVLPLNFSTK